MIIRPVVFELLMFFFLMILGGGAQILGLPGELGLPQWAPGLAGLVMLLIFRRDHHWLTFFYRRTPPLRYLWAIMVPVLGALVVFVLTRPVAVEPGAATVIASPLLLILLSPLGALGEEIGWRGYLNKRLDTRWRGLVTALVVGLLWTPMHIHLFPNGLVYILCFTLLLVSYSIVIFALTQDTGFSILLATLFHLAINYSNLLFLDRINETSFMAINGAVWLGIALVTLLTRRQQFLSPRATPETEPLGPGFSPS